MAALADLLLRARATGLVTVLALLAVAVAWVPHLRVELSPQALMEGDAEQMARVVVQQRQVPYERIDLVVLASWAEPVGSRELEALAQLETGLGALPEVGLVTSLASAEVAEVRAGLPLPRAVRDLVGARGGGAAALAAVVARHPLLAPLLSADGRSAALLLATAGGSDEGALLTAVEAVLPRLAPPGVRVRLLGSEPVQRALRDGVVDAMLRSGTLELLVFLVLLPLLFRSVRGVALPLVVVAAALVFYFALLVWFGLPLTMLDVAVPGLITILGLCDAIHMVHRFDEERAKGAGRDDAIRRMLGGVGTACFHTSFTTAIGFASLAVARHDAVRAFGLKAALGVLVTWLVVTVLLPLCLAVWPASAVARRPERPVARWDPFDHWLRRATPVVVVLLVVAVALGLSRVRVDSRWLEELPSDHPVAADVAWYSDAFGGPLRLSVQLRGDLAAPAAVAAVAGLQAALSAEPEVHRTESYVDWLREVAGQPDVLDAAAVRRAAGLLPLLGDRFPVHVVDRGFEHGRLVLTTGDLGSARCLELQQRIEQLAAELPDDLHAEPAGYALMAHHNAQLVVSTMLESIALSLLAITLFTSLVYRSWRIGLVSIVPNSIPVLVALGVNGLCDIPLRIGIVMIYSLGVGLAVDDSIHVLTRFSQERRADPAAHVDVLLHRTLRSTGRALCATSLALLLGGLCYLPTDLRSTRDAGVLLGVIVVTALWADLYLLPGLLRRIVARQR